MLIFKVILFLPFVFAASAAPKATDTIAQLLERINLMESSFQERFNSQKAEMKQLQDTIDNLQSIRTKAKATESKSIYRTCEEIRSAEPDSPSGDYWIDPDGAGYGDAPILVYCSMTTGTTGIYHDSEYQMQADRCPEPGCYNRTVAYNATVRQMEALKLLSQSCSQQLRFDCLSVPSDQGYITNKDELPVMRLHFGRAPAEASFEGRLLGRLECSGKYEFNGMPDSCERLWMIGHRLNGFYNVKGSKEMRSVYCDFRKVPGDQGIETDIGLVDVKSSHVIFHVQRQSSFNSGTSVNPIIPFENERLNIGNAMNIISGIFCVPKAGTYYFTFSAVKGKSDIAIVSLYLNDKNVSSSKTHANNDNYSLSLSSTLKLNVGDEISVRLREGNLGGSTTYFNYYTNFNGILLQEDIF